MKHVLRKAYRNAHYLLIVVFCLVILITDIGQAQRNKTSWDYNPEIKIEEFPPDFELPRLTIKTDETGKSVGIINERDTVRLSSFRGKKPVCLIMSSYT
jgi:hypothetical protein